MTVEQLIPDTVAISGQKRPERIDIGDGLIMRWSTRADAQNVADCMAEAFRWVQLGATLKEDEEPKPNQWVHAAIKRLLRGNSGVMTEFDYALVENTLAKEGENPIVACMCLMTSPGYYGKVDLVYGKPECVGSHPAYRNKGLIRRLFTDMIHPASDRRGDVIQIIPGIPHFYLQFGYEYAVGVRSPREIADVFATIPEVNPTTKKPDSDTVPVEEELFKLRKPTVDDIPYLVKLSTPEKMLNQAEVGLTYNEAYWRYTAIDAIETAQSKFDTPRSTRIIVDAKTGRDCGIIMMTIYPPGSLVLHIFTLEEGYHYRDALYPVLRQMIQAASEPNAWQLEELKACQDENDQEEKSKLKIQHFVIFLDSQHPVTKLLESRSKTMASRPRFYTRIPSYANFILKVAPTLEDRLAKSCMAGVTVTWQFDFYRKVLGSSGKGLEVVFKEGKIVHATDDWVQPTPEAEMHAARARIAKAKEEGRPDKKEGRPDKKPLVFKAKFAPLTFTKLLMGDLPIAQMLNLYAECSVTGGDEAEAMLDILFPKQQFHFDQFWW